MARSSAYWAGNRYADPAQEPEATAPLQDLPAPVAARFGLLRDGLRELPGVDETVRYMGQSWRWAWEYGIGNRKLCWMHVIGDVVSTTFTLNVALPVLPCTSVAETTTSVSPRAKALPEPGL